MKELSLPRFRDWLEGLDGRTTAGWQTVSWACPLASYLGAGWSVSQRSARWMAGVPTREQTREHPDVLLPLWARRFVRAVDALPPTASGTPRRITARMALELLQGIRGPTGDV